LVISNNYIEMHGQQNIKFCNYLSMCRESKSDGAVGNLVTTQTELPKAYRVNTTLLTFVEDDG
jgi:hypothetical protein